VTIATPGESPGHITISGAAEHVMVVLVLDESASLEALVGTLDSVHRQTHDSWSLAIVAEGVDESRLGQLGQILARPWYAPTVALHPSHVLAEARSRQAEFVFITRVGVRLIDSALERCVFLSGWREASTLSLPIWRRWDTPHDLYFQTPTSEPLDPVSLGDDIDTAVFRSMFDLATFRRLSETGPPTGVMVHDYLLERVRRGSVWGPSADETAREPGPRSPRSPLSQSGDVWLFAERKGTVTADNAWAMFKWMCRNQPAIESYYVLNPEVVYEGPPEFAKRIVRKGSMRWGSLLSKCKVALVNDSAGDLLLRAGQHLQYPEIYWVYLTHGALGVFPGVYQRRHRYFDLVCTESDHASDEAAELWGFPRGIFAETGLTRWDNLQDTPPDGDILFLPTWRKSLEGPGVDASSSAFVRFAAQLLGSERLNNLLVQTNRKLRVGMHFRARHLLEYITAQAGDRIEIIDLEDPTTSVASELANCGALISDYSSVSWDVLVQGKATFLCQFDKLDWCRERGMQYLRAPHTEALFELSYGVDELLDQLEASVLPSGIVPREIPDAVRERYLPRPGGSNCQAVFDEIVTRFGRKSTQTEPVARWTTETYDLTPLEQSAGDASTIFIGSNRLLLEMGPKALPATMAQVNDLLDCGSSEIVFQPCLEGESVWADDLFSIEKTVDLVESLSAAATRAGAKLTVATMPDYPFRQELAAGSNERLVELQLNVPSPFGPRSSIDVSVIIPCFNSETGIERCIRSVMNQRFHGSVEVIVVDDGSTDGSSALIQKLQREFDNLLYIGKPNGRQGSARNLGILTCRGRTLTFLDSDDELAEHALGKLFVALEESDADISTGFHVSITEDGTTHLLNQSHVHYLSAPRYISGLSWPGLHIDPSAVAKLYRTDFVLENALFFSYSYHEDELFRSLTELKGARYVNIREGVYRYHAKSVATGTTRFDSVKFSQVLRVGHLISELFARSANDDVRRVKASHLLRRYVRFWQKCQETAPEALTPEVLGLLKAFVDSVPAEWCSSVGGAAEMAAALGLSSAHPVDDGSPVAFSARTGAKVVLNDLEPYNYFARRVLWSDNVGNENQESDTTELSESTSYKLGSLLVQAVAQPGLNTVKLPIELSSMAYRAARQKVRNRIESDSESPSRPALIAHRWASFRYSDPDNVEED